MPFKVIFEPIAISGFLVSGNPITQGIKPTPWVLAKIIADKMGLEQ